MIDRRQWVASAGIAAVLICFAVPLCVGLREPEMRSDEAIYSYAVERMLETGDWLTPRSIPTDEPFVEKPPLKFWLVAAGMAAGVLPHDEAGMRMLDALFGAVGFLYVYLLGRRLAGVACGVAALLVLFTLDPLLFEHGLRSNNMEAPLFLAYCGGLFHFVRWVEAGRAHARGDALAVAAYFTLGFMTKFVAVLFLPVIGVVALATHPAALARLRTGWSDWPLPIVLALAVPAPWFLYEASHLGPRFWQIIFGTHVYQRFTSALDPAHLQPWHHYFTATWAQVAHAGSQLLVVSGAARLAFVTWRRTHPSAWLARVVIVWGLLPLVLMSLGTSKLLHYAYPFWPPIGLAAGAGFAWLWSQVDARFPSPTREIAPSRRARQFRRFVAGVAMLLVAIAIWTAVMGPVWIEAGGLVIFRNSSVLRPLLFAGVLLGVAASAATPVRLAGAATLALLLPLGSYADKIQQLGRIDHPLRATRDCLRGVQDSGTPVGRGVLSASGNILHHSYYYYLWRLGPWDIAPEFSAGEVLARLMTIGQQTPVILQRSDYDAIRFRLPAPLGAARFDDRVAILLPGAYRPCETAIHAAGGQTLWK